MAKLLPILSPRIYLGPSFLNLLASPLLPLPSPPLPRRGGHRSGSLLLQVLSHLCARQQSADAIGLIEGLVGKEADVGRKFEVDRAGDLAADVALMVLERRQHGPDILPAQRHDI